MRRAGAMSILALGAGSLAFGQEAPTLDQKIADIQRQLDALKAEQKAQTEPVPATEAAPLDTRLDGAVRNSPTEALREPRRLNISAPWMDGLNITGLLHLRGDFWANYDSGAGNNDVQSFGTEAQLAFDARVSEKTSVRVVLHYSDIWGNDTAHGLGGTGRLTADAPSSNGGDIAGQEVNLNVQDIYGTGIDLTAGRQLIQFGSERILGDDEWRLTRTSLDGFRFDNDMGDMAGKWSLIAVRLQDNDNGAVGELVPTAPAAPGNNPVNNADLFGFYYTVAPRDLGTVDVYVFLLDDFNYSDNGAVGRTRLTTYGVRWESADFNGFGVEAEGATQFGKIFGESFHNYGFGTYAVHAEASYQPGNIEYFDGLYAMFDHATGGDEPEENFTQILPTLHGWFGMTDFFSWTNIQHFGVAAGFQLGDGTATVGYHWNRRASNSAGFTGYNMSAAGTGGSKELGQELTGSYFMECTKSTSVGVGVGYFMPGEGFHDLTGVSNDMVFSYFASTTRF